MERRELMIHERRKAIIRALAELEIAANTFIDAEGFKEFDEVRKKLIEYKQNHLD